MTTKLITSKQLAEVAPDLLNGCELAIKMLKEILPDAKSRGDYQVIEAAIKKAKDVGL